MAGVGTSSNHPLGIPLGAAALFDSVNTKPIVVFEQPDSFQIPGDGQRISPHVSFSRHCDLLLFGPLLYDIFSILNTACQTVIASLHLKLDLLLCW